MLLTQNPHFNERAAMPDSDLERQLSQAGLLNLAGPCHSMPFVPAVPTEVTQRPTVVFTIGLSNRSKPLPD
jgi:hypothetical protein